MFTFPKNMKLFPGMLMGALFLNIFLFPRELSAFEIPSSKTVLDNGLTVVISEMPTSSMVSVYALVKTGSATEGEYLGSGISHFLEHMLFKGTKRRKVGEIASSIQAVGGNINASTATDYTIFTITVPQEKFDIALDTLSDMLMNSVMDPEQVERERQVIFGEMRLHHDNPDRKLSELVFQNVYSVHPYKYPVIGFEPLFKKMTPDDILHYYHSRYIPNNIILSIAGNVNTQNVLPKIKEAFANFSSKPYVMRNLPNEPQQITPRLDEETYPTNLTRLSLAFNGMRLLDKDLYAMDVLAKILGDGESSRLYLDVYKKRELVYNISASNYTPMDRGFFEIDALLNQPHIENTIKAILENIYLIKKSGVSKEELEKAKRQVLSEHILGQQRSSQLAYFQAVDEAYTGDYQFSRKYVEAVRKVTNEDILKAANQYLNDEAMTTVILKPQEAAKASSTVDALKPHDIVKEILDNGLTVLLKEDHTFPVTAIRLVFNGGIRQEPEELNGISSLTARTWLKGTKTRSAEQIASESESLGMNLDAHSGKNSFGINLEFLSENQRTAMELLEDVVRNPLFPEGEITRSKEIMKADIKQRDDNITQFTGHALKQILFLTHPFRLEEEGSEESLSRITRTDIFKFYDQLVAPNNMVLAVYGDIDPVRTLADIKKQFGSLKQKDMHLLTHSESPPSQPRYVDLTMDKEQAMVMIGFHGVRLADPDYYGMEILTSILGSSFSGRLFTSIREKLGEAYTLGGDSLPGIDAGMVYFHVLTTGEHVDQVKDIIISEIKKLQNEYVGDDELNDVKNYLKGNFQSSQETSASLSFITSLDELYSLGYNNYKRFDAQIEQVTKTDVRRLALKYLDLNKMAVVVTRPKTELNKKP